MARGHAALTVGEPGGSALRRATRRAARRRWIKSAAARSTSAHTTADEAMTEGPGPALSDVAAAPAPSKPLTPCDADWVGVGEGVPVPDKARADWVGVGGREPVPLNAAPDKARVGVSEGVAVSEPVGEGVRGSVGPMDALRAGEAEGDGVGEGVCDCVGVGVGAAGAPPLLVR